MRQRKSPAHPALVERPLPAAPVVGEIVRIPIEQFGAYLRQHRLRVDRRVDLPDGAWRVELVDQTGGLA